MTINRKRDSKRSVGAEGQEVGVRIFADDKTIAQPLINWLEQHLPQVPVLFSEKNPTPADCKDFRSITVFPAKTAKELLAKEACCYQGTCHSTAVGYLPSAPNEATAMDLAAAGLADVITPQTHYRLGMLWKQLDQTPLTVPYSYMEDRMQKLELLTNNHYATYITCNRAGKITSTCPTVQHFISWKPEEIRGQNRLAFLHPDDRPRAQEAWEQCLEQPGHAEEVIVRVRANDDSYRWVKATYRNLLDEPLIGEMVINFKEITKKKQAQEKLWQVTNAVPGVLYEFKMRPDGEMSFAYISAQCETFFGLPQPSGTVPLKEVMNSLMQPEDQQQLIPTILASARELSPWDQQMRMIRPDTGAVQWVRGHSIPQRVADGTIVWIGFFTNITKLKETEEALKESRNQLARAQMLAQMGHFIWHVEDPGATWSEELFHLFGMEPESRKIPIQEYINRIHPDDREEVVPIVQGSEGDSYTVSHRIITPQGEVRYLQASGEAHRDHEGNVQKVLGILQDHTATHHREATLAEAQRQLQSVVHSAPGIIFEFEFDETGAPHFIFLSEQTKTIIGLDPQAFLEDFWLAQQVVAPSKLNRILKEVKRSAKLKEPWSQDFQVQPAIPNGVRWLHGHAVPHRHEDGTITWAGIFLDITQHKETEHALKTSRDQLSLAQKLTKSGSFIWDAKRDEAQWSDEMYRLLELAPFAEKVTMQDYINCVHPEDREEFYQLFDEVSHTAGAHPLAHRVLTPKGTLKYVKGQAEVFLDEQGQLKQIVGSIQDVTQTHLYEQALEEKEAQLRAITNAVPGVLYELRQYGPDNLKFTFISKQTQEIFGLSQEAALEDMMAIFSLIPAEALHQMLENFKKQPFEFGLKETEFPIIHAETGKKRWIKARALSHYDDEGFKTWTGIFIDITEEKKMQETLELSERSYREVFNNSSDSIYVADQYGGIIDVNEIALSQYGYRREELIGRSFRVFDGSEDGPETKVEQIIHAWEGEEQTFTCWGRRKNGRIFPKEVVLRKGLYSDKEVMFVYERDITERQRTEEALKRSENLFRQLFQNAPVAIVTLDDHDKIVAANRGFTDVFGYTEQEVLYRSLNEVIVPPSEANHAEVLSRDAVQGRSFVVEGNRQHKDGRLVPVMIYGVPVDQGDKEVRYYGIYVDMSNQKRAKEELLAKNTVLERYADDLEQFAFVTSHNLRSPVANFKGLLSLYNHEEPADEWNKTVVEKLGETAEKLDTTINDLVDIVLKSKHSENANEEVSFEAVLQATQQDFNVTITEAGAVIKHHFSPGSIHYPKAHLESIFHNMVSNALKYQHPERPLELHITTQQEGPYIHLRFTDNGLGINLEEQSHKIFRMYQRLHMGVAEGKGLGLYIVKRQVISLGGKVEVESEPGSGTKFHLYLKEQPRS